MVLVGFFKKAKYVIDFTTDEKVSKFEAFANQKLDTVYVTETMRT